MVRALAVNSDSGDLTAALKVLPTPFLDFKQVRVAVTMTPL